MLLPTSDKDEQNVLAYATSIVTAYAGQNSISGADLVQLIRQVHSTLTELSDERGAVKPAAVESPAIEPERSVTHKAIFCLECRRPLQTLRRHLGARHGLTPDDYRRKWGLPHDYPMVAPAYSGVRSRFAKDAHFGQRPKAKRKPNRK